MQTSVHIFCQPRCSCSWGPRSSSSTSSPLISSQQKVLKSFSFAKVFFCASELIKMGIISSQLFHLPGGGSEKWAPFVLSGCLWVEEWKFQFQYQEATRIVEKLRESLRSPEKPRESLRRPKKPWEASRSPKKTQEDPRRHKKTREARRKLYWGFLRTALLLLCLPPAPQIIMGEMLRNQTEEKQAASSTSLDFIM